MLARTSALRATILALGIASSLPAAPAAVFASPSSDWARATPLDPMSAYGNQIVFEVLRNGEPAGTHTVTFDRDGEDLLVRTRFELEVRLLFVTAYRYAYASLARWRDGQLMELRADTNDDGTETRVVAERQGPALRVQGPQGDVSAPVGIFPTNHWHPGVLATSQVLNTITGRINDVRIIEHGVEQVRVNGQWQNARRYAYTGELNNEVWYDRDGRWVRMRFTAKDGSIIDYVCQACRAPGAGAV